jgi:Ca2+/H+ antiporter, TMEM165/GDT1 family
VTDFVTALVIAFGVVFVAELGDKTQLLALNFGARYSLRTVALGLTIGYAVANVVATVVGGILGAALPDRPIQIVGGLIFLVFAIAALRPIDADDDEPGTASVARQTTPAVVMAIAASIAVAEMGDKTQIATATLASQSSPIGVWIGATLGAASSGMVGAAAGSLIGDRIPIRALQVASALLFAAFGVAMLAGWF